MSLTVATFGNLANLKIFVVVKSFNKLPIYFKKFLLIEKLNKLLSADIFYNYF